MIIQNFKSDLKIVKNGKVKKGTLELAGDLTIQNAAHLKDCLLEALNSVDACDLDLKKVDQVDLAGIQVLYAAYRSAQTRNKSLALCGDCPVPLQNAVTTAGMDCIDWLCFGKTD